MTVLAKNPQDQQQTVKVTSALPVCWRSNWCTGNIAEHCILEVFITTLLLLCYLTVQKVKSIDNVAGLNDLLLCAKFALRMLS